MRLEQQFFLAMMGRGRDPHRPAAGQRHQPFQLGVVGRRRQHVELEIAGGHHIGAAERGEPLGIGRRLREANVEAAEQRRDGRRGALPARERARRHPAIDHHHRQTPRGAGQDQVGPQVGFDEQRETRLPVIEEARDIARRIERNELVDDVGRKAPRHDRRRGGGARGQEDAHVHGAQPLDQPRGGQHLADAGAVNPDQRAMRPRHGGDAAPLRDALGDFLAAHQAAADQQRRERRQRRRQPPVQAQRQRQPISHSLPLAVGRPA